MIMPVLVCRDSKTYYSAGPESYRCIVFRGANRCDCDLYHDSWDVDVTWTPEGCSSQHRFTLRVKCSTTIEDMKKSIEEMLEVSHFYQHIEYPGESFIEGDRVLQHFSKPNGATFSLGLLYSYLWSAALCN